MQNPHKMIILFLTLCFSANALAGGVGTSCNYYTNGDSQCDVANGIYCTMYTCQIVSDTNTYCSDADANNLTTSGSLTSRYRSYDGSFSTANVGDDCLNVNQFVSSCSGTNCNIREATCTGGSNYTFTTYQCNSCLNGACTSGQYGVLGKTCDYSTQGDSQCDPQNSIYCESYMCRNVSDPSVYCSDPDANTLSTGTTVNSRARDYSGTFLNTNNADSCMSGNTLTSNCSGANCFVREVTCNQDNMQAFNSYPCQSCSNGACTSPPPSGPTCNYYTNQDTQCSPGTYCLGGTCTSVADPSLSCTDTDANNLTQSGTLTSRQRGYDGNWMNIIVGDDCMNGNQFVTSCSGTNCNVREATCTTGPNYTFSTYTCLSCSQGACTSPEYSSQDSNTEGNACNYTSLGDSQCNPDQNVFCISNKCTHTDQNVTALCTDSDYGSTFIAGDISFVYRNYLDGNVASGSRPDVCLDANRLKEYLCKRSEPTGYTSENIQCTIGCSHGACIQPFNPDLNAHCSNQAKDFDESAIDCGGAYCRPCEQLPQSISDEELLLYVSQWRDGNITNTTLLSAIRIWKTERGPE